MINLNVLDPSSIKNTTNLKNKFDLEYPFPYSMIDIKFLGSKSQILEKGDFFYKFIHFNSIHFNLGSGTIENIKISIKPPTSFFMILECSDIPQYYEYIFQQRNLTLKKNELILKNQYYVYFTVNVRECTIGEIFIPSISMSD